MRWRLFGLALAMAVFPTSAAADPVVVLGPHGNASVRNDPFVTGPAVTPAPSRPRAWVAQTGRRTVSSELARLHRSGAIDLADYRTYGASWSAAARSERRLHGTRRVELGAVIANLRSIASGGQLTRSRLAPLFLTLDRNRQWWTTGPLLAGAQRIEFTGSPLLWQYYPGQGVQLTMLGNFGKANGLYTAGRSHYQAFQAMLDELIPLAARRGGMLTWEYYFRFGGGVPPWTSAMSQGTAIEALTRGYQALHRRNSGLRYVDYFGLAHKALAIFTRRPRLGVAVRTAHGARYVQYSFAPAPSADIINAFLQSLIGLYDYARLSGDRLAASLFAAGNAQAKFELPRFDTGAWSLYQPGLEDSLSYHQLVTGFLHQLCARTGAAVYCGTAQRFEADLRTPPALSLLTTRVRVRRATAVRFRLSKISHVGIVVLRGGHGVFATSAQVAHGVHAFAIPALRRTGRYTLRLAATDLAGNFNRTVGTIQATR